MLRSNASTELRQWPRNKNTQIGDRMNTKSISVRYAADAIEFGRLRKMYARDPVVIPLIELAAVEASIIRALSSGEADGSHAARHALFSLVDRADEAFKALAVMLHCREEIVQTERNLLAELAAAFAKTGSGSDPGPACGVCPVDRDIAPCDESRCAERLADWALNEAAKLVAPSLEQAAGPGNP